MDGIHDLGGMQGFGLVEREANEPVFHEPWQATTFALLIATVGTLRSHNADEYRHSIERMRPSHYLQSHYYERVLTGLTTLLVEKGVVSHAELEALAGAPVPLSNPIAENPMATLVPQPTRRFAVGDRVRVLDIHPAGHTRVPRFVRGKTGTVLHVAPAFSFPDTSAHAGELREEHTYHVEFASASLWPDTGHENESVVVDLWDSYLEATER
jgi:nitrile hydratase